MSKVFQVDTGGTLTTNLLAYWKLEDNTDYWSTYNLTAHGSPTYDAGKVGNALDLGSSNSGNYMTYGGAPGSVNPTNNWSIAGWIYLYSLPSSGSYYNWLDFRNGGYCLASIKNTSGSYYLSGNMNSTDNDTAVSISTGTWYHIVITVDGSGNWNIYLNGTSVSNGLSNGTGQSAKFYLGSTSNPSNYVPGKLDEFGFWSKALSSQEISDLYNGGSGQTMTTSGGGTTPKNFTLLGVG